VTEPKNKAAICEGAVKSLEHLKGQPPRPIAQPDVIDRQHEAVELVVGTAVGDGSRSSRACWE
jgi:hypothetical protein